MNAYKIDRAVLEEHSSADIRRILRDERDDYTPEALKIFEEILEARGETLAGPGKSVAGTATGASYTSYVGPEERLIRTPAEARRLLDDVLKGVLNGSVEPQVGQAVSSLVMSMLRAMELEYVSETEEEA